jgi:beta-glucosidase
LEFLNTMSKPRRVITIHLPHRDPAAAAFFTLLILFALFLGGLSPYFPKGCTGEAEPEAPPVYIPNSQLAGKALNERVEGLLTKMTLADKIGQLSQYSSGAMTGPGSSRDDLNDLISKGQVGSLFNVVGAKATNRFQHIAVEKSPLHIPLLFGYDVIHGDRTTFPVPLALASSFDPGLVEQVSHVAASEAAEDGIRWVFSPMVDIARDARWGRITEGAGEDTYLGSVMAAAYVRGYQGDDLSKPDSVAACVKHFAAYGAPNAGREYNTVDMSELTLRQVYLPPYHAAINAGCATVMSAFNPLNGVPATADPFTLTKILRDEWNFDGLVVSDFGAVRELIAHGVASTGAIAARKAISAGVDMDMMSDLYRTRLATLAKSGALPQSVIDEAVRRVLRVKFALGLFDHPYANESLPPYAPTPDKRALARQAAAETFVLLKNGAKPIPFMGRMLPLAKNDSSIALIGPLADSQVDMLGTWPGAGDPANVVTVRSALQARCGFAKSALYYAKGTDILSDSEDGFSAAIAAAKKADVVVLALGEAAVMNGESASLTRLDLPGNQEQLLEAVTKIGKPTVLVLFAGRPLAIKWAAAHVPAILQAWSPGIEAGPAVADALFGDTNPSGKLPATFPRAVGQEPIFYNQLPTGRPAADDIDLSHPPTNSEDKYLSRYIDETNAPLFPFGYGLSYTTFAYSKVKLSQESISSEAITHPKKGHFFATPENIKVTAVVTNSGSAAGTEVVQLYIRNTGGSVEEPVRELKGFQRITLQPGESKEVDFTLGFNELSYYNLEMNRVIEPTEYQVWVGGSSSATQGAQFEVTEK